MDNERLQVYTHYKSLYGSMLLLFRVKNSYEAYFDDAEYIASILSNTGIMIETDVSRTVLPSSEILEVVGKVAECGKTCKLIQQRNSAGEFALPDLVTMKIEQEMDY